MKTFSKEFYGWSLRNNDHLMLTYVETTGNNLEEMIDNAMISLENWHGEEVPNWNLEDLSTSDYGAIIKLFIKSLEETV